MVTPTECKIFKNLRENYFEEKLILHKKLIRNTNERKVIGLFPDKEGLAGSAKSYYSHEWLDLV